MTACIVGWAHSRFGKLEGVTLDDLSFVETHDCFTIAELIEYETMGLAKPGEGAALGLATAFAEKARPVLTNWNGIDVGSLRPTGAFDA